MDTTALLRRLTRNLYQVADPDGGVALRALLFVAATASNIAVADADDAAAGWDSCAVSLWEAVDHLGPIVDEHEAYFDELPPVDTATAQLRDPVELLIRRIAQIYREASMTDRAPTRSAVWRTTSRYLDEAANELGVRHQRLSAAADPTG